MGDDVTTRFVLVGPAEGGKSKIVDAIMGKGYSESCTSTIGVNFVFKKVKVGGTQVRCNIWDTGGKERFQSLIPAYTRDAKCIFYVLDPTSDTNKLENDIQTYCSGAKDTDGNQRPIVVLVNKSESEQVDATKLRQLEKNVKDAFDALSLTLDSLYFVSARENQNTTKDDDNNKIQISEIVGVFTTIAKKIVKTEQQQGDVVVHESEERSHSDRQIKIKEYFIGIDGDSGKRQELLDNGGTALNEQEHGVSRPGKLYPGYVARQLAVIHQGMQGTLGWDQVLRQYQDIASAKNNKLFGLFSNPSTAQETKIHYTESANADPFVPASANNSP